MYRHQQAVKRDLHTAKTKHCKHMKTNIEEEWILVIYKPNFLYITSLYNLMFNIYFHRDFSRSLTYWKTYTTHTHTQDAKSIRLANQPSHLTPYIIAHYWLTKPKRRPSLFTPNNFRNYPPISGKGYDIHVLWYAGLSTAYIYTCSN